MIRFRNPSQYFSFDVQGATLERVDYAKGMICGASAAQAVEALGHGMMLDDVFLGQVRDAVNASNGKQVRFTHPGMCDDGLGSLVGHASNARLSADKVLVDIKMSQVAKKSPKGDLYDYVMKMAEKHPEDMGMSVVFQMSKTVWKLADGTEVDVKYDDDGPLPSPPGATNTLPIPRLKQLKAIDIVGEGAANRDGLFSSTSSEEAEKWFDRIDELLGVNKITVDALQLFVTKYVHARSAKLSPKEPLNMDPKTIKALSVKYASQSAKLMECLAEGLDEKAVESAMAAHQQAELSSKALQTAEALQAERAARAADKVAHDAALKAQSDRIAALEAKLAGAQKVAELASGTPADVGAHEGEGSPDSIEALSSMSDEQLKKHFKSNAKLQAQFLGDFSVFKSFLSMGPENHLLSPGGSQRFGLPGEVKINQGGSTFTPIDADAIARGAKSASAVIAAGAHTKDEE
jgi:hypothetical protein